MTVGYPAGDGATNADDVFAYDGDIIDVEGRTEAVLDGDLYGEDGTDGTALAATRGGAGCRRLLP